MDTIPKGTAVLNEFGVAYAYYWGALILGRRLAGKSMRELFDMVHDTVGGIKWDSPRYGCETGAIAVAKNEFVKYNIRIIHDPRTNMDWLAVDIEPNHRHLYASKLAWLRLCLGRKVADFTKVDDYKITPCPLSKAMEAAANNYSGDFGHDENLLRELPLEDLGPNVRFKHAAFELACAIDTIGCMVRELATDPCVPLEDINVSDTFFYAFNEVYGKLFTRAIVHMYAAKLWATKIPTNAHIAEVLKSAKTPEFRKFLKFCSKQLIYKAISSDDRVNYQSAYYIAKEIARLKYHTTNFHAVFSVFTRLIAVKQYPWH